VFPTKLKLKLLSPTPSPPPAPLAPPLIGDDADDD